MCHRSCLDCLRPYVEALPDHVNRWNVVDDVPQMVEYVPWRSVPRTHGCRLGSLPNGLALAWNHVVADAWVYGVGEVYRLNREFIDLHGPPCHLLGADVEHRVAVVAKDADEAAGVLREVADGGTPDAAVQPLGKARRGLVAFLFTGQGSQYAGMGRELFSVFRDNVSVAEAGGTIFR